MAAWTTTIPGYPRITADRRYKTIIEGFWQERTNAAEVTAALHALEADLWQSQLAAGLDVLTCGDFSWYDQMLDMAVLFGSVPARFGWDGGAITPELYWGLARGIAGAAPLEMTKWFDTNYHYLVPELPAAFSLTTAVADWIARVRRACALAPQVKVALIGPWTFLRLARVPDAELSARLAELVPLYASLLADLHTAGARWVQLDESALALDTSEQALAALETAYAELHALAPQVPLLLHTAYGSVAELLPRLVALPLAGLGLDFHAAAAAHLTALAALDWPAELLLVAGVIDGRNVWRSDLAAQATLLGELAALVGAEHVWLSTSCSLLHLPETVAAETALPPTLLAGLCFARERLAELTLLCEYLRGTAAPGAWEAAATALDVFANLSDRTLPAVRAEAAALTEADWTRPPFNARRPLQQAVLNLPPLPTTTIGSFPQTPELRRARARAAAEPEAYQATIAAEIERVIRLQEGLGLDVLVHGEPERNDMVQFFAEQLGGCATTQLGWVQSYGTRCVRPPLIYGDVQRRQPLTVALARFAQALTARPVKGMLTGPVTILRWSFVRADLPAAAVAEQLALAIRAETVALEQEAGLRIIQIDEPAFREGLPLRRADWPAYLEWAVRAFRVASAGVAPQVQIHTHMCYSDFGDIIAAIAALDADVISIEDARSSGAMLQTLRDFGYALEVGPGIYDIHSPTVPTAAELTARLRALLRYLPADQVWVNPDCGLKTRRYAEVEPALRALVAAVHTVREELLNARTR